MATGLEQLCRDLEHFETDEWAAHGILKHERLPGIVLDPCTGTGILARAAWSAGYMTITQDIRQWDGIKPHVIGDFLQRTTPPVAAPWSVLMNPPFSKACQFVEHSLQLGASKVVCFQRFAWRECRDRRDFWRASKASRVYVCGDRAVCWRHDLPRDAAGNRYDPATGRKLGRAPTAHAWFVFEPGYSGSTELLDIWKDDK